jgi:hypothetical protein
MIISYHPKKLANLTHRDRSLPIQDIFHFARVYRNTLGRQDMPKEWHFIKLEFTY